MSDEKARRNQQMERFANLLEDVVRDINPDAEFSWKKMFGGAAYYANGVMVAGMYTNESLALKLSSADCADLLAKGGVQEGMGKNTVELPVAMLDDKDTLKEWVSKSLDYAVNRPVKKKKK